MCRPWSASALCLSTAALAARNFAFLASMLLNLRPCADCAQDEWRQIHIHNSASEFFLVYYRQLHTNVLNKCYLESLPLLVGGQDRSLDRQGGGEQDQCECGVHGGARTAGVSLGSYFTLFIPFPMICSDVVLLAVPPIKQQNIERYCTIIRL